MDEVEMVEQRHAQRGLAMMTRAYYLELVDQGFNKKEALQLTAAWMASMLNAAIQKGTDGD